MPYNTKSLTLITDFINGKNHAKIRFSGLDKLKTFGGLHLYKNFVGFFRGGGGTLENPKDSVWEDWGTLGNSRGNTTPVFPPLDSY